MSPLAVKTFRSIPTKYELNGPKLSFSLGTSQQPSSVTINNGQNASFTGIVTVAYPTNIITPPSGGTITYQWYDQNGIVTNGSRFNDATLGTTVISGANTNTLSITNALNPTDTDKRYYLVANFSPPPGNKNIANALNGPLKSNEATLSIRPYLTLVTQPSSASETIDNSVTFNTSAIVSDSTSSQISYQWRINGTNLSNGTFNDRVVSGANGTSLTIKVTTPGTYTIDCVITHPATHPSSVITNTASYQSRDKVKEVVIETLRIGSPGDFSGSPAGTRYKISESPVTVTRTGSDQRWTCLFAPDKDVDVLITMGGAAAEGDKGGQGGWMTFRYTLKKGVEHSFILQERNSGGDTKPDSSGRKEGNRGGGAAYFYRLNEIVAVCGGGGGGSQGGAGGDGSGGNIPNGTRRGTKGQGTNGGRGGSEGPDNNSPGGITEAGYEYYWFTGIFDSNNTFSKAADSVDLNKPDSPPTNILGPASQFSGQFMMLDYRSNKTYNGEVAATRGSRIYNNPRGSVNHINMLGDNKNDCYRIKTDSSGKYEYIQDSDKDTTNNIQMVNVADFKAGRRSIYFSNVDSSNNWLATDLANKEPNTFRNLIGNGLGQTPGYVINYHNYAVKIENVGGSDDIDSTFNGKPRKTKAYSTIFERDNPRYAYGVVANNSAEIIRAFKFADGSRANGGWSRNGGAGGGAGAQGGESGSGYPTWSGAGGGSGWAGNGATVYQSVTGGSFGNAFYTIWAVDDTKTIESQLPPQPTPPNLRWEILNWNDPRNHGWKSSSLGEQWRTDASGGISYSVGSCSNGNGTYIQGPLAKDASGNWINRGGLNEQTNDYHRLFVGGCPTSFFTGALVSSFGGSNLYFTRGPMIGNADNLGNTLWNPLRINSLTNGLDRVSYLDFELKLTDFSPARFETSKGSQIYTSDNRPDEKLRDDLYLISSTDRSKALTDYYYNESRPPSKYLWNSNGVRRRWNPLTDLKDKNGNIQYPSSRYTSSFNEAYIPFEIKVRFVLEFRDIKFHDTDESIGDTAINQWKRIEYISDWIDYGSPWTRRTLEVRSSDLWNTTHYSGKGSGSKFYPYNSSNWNYKDPFITNFEIYQIRDKDTGSINSLSIYPVISDYRDYVQLEVGRGILI